jgi:hypothetical protein
MAAKKRKPIQPVGYNFSAGVRGKYAKRTAGIKKGVADMTLEQLRMAVGAQPFLPFQINLADGREFRVGHPECILIPPQASRTFVVAESGEDYTIIDLLLVTSLAFGNGNAKTRSRRR